MFTTRETIERVSNFIEAILSGDDTNTGELSHMFTLAIDGGDLPNADAAALIELAINEEEDEIAVLHLEQALEFLLGEAATK